MRIKKLELLGFKSFKDRTMIHFDHGITGIVGPNGCGKSNIVDALRWVMGEMSAKNLRGSAMDDVIFAGAEGYAPLGMAEVSLTLENDGGAFPAKYSRFSEVMVTRRLHRSGETDYMINREPARLRDIQEIFMDTGAGSKGFSVIEQGAIGRIITAKPEERRTLIEEAAGITKFKVRKRESQRKLTATDQNLVRLQDIIGEQKRQLDSLQRQAQRAERYRNLKNQVQEKEMWLTSKQYLQMREQSEEAERLYTDAKENEVTASSDLSQKESELQEMKLNLTEKEKMVEDRQAKANQASSTVQSLESEIRELSFEIESARRTSETTGSVMSQYKARQDALVKDQADLSTRSQDAEKLATELTDKYHSQKGDYDRIQSRIAEVDDELTAKRKEMLTVSQGHTHLEARIVSMDEKIQTQEEEQQTQSQVLAELKTQNADFEERRNRLFKELEEERQMQLSIMQDVENFEDNAKQLRASKETKEHEVAEFKDNLNEITSRLYGLENMQNNFEGFQEGVKNVMLWQRQRMEQRADGSAEVITEFQPVSDVVEVPEKFELAMEAALGNKLQMLLSKDVDTAVNAVDYLKEQNSGRSSFASSEMAWNGSDESKLESLRGKDGVEGFLNEVVRVPDEMLSQVGPFLKGVAIVDSVRSALKLRPDHQGITFVTLEGDTLTAEGVLTGGSSESADSGVLKRKREIKELSQKREEAAGKLSLAQAALKKLESQLKTVEEELEKAREQRVEKEIRVAELKKDFERAETELENAKKAVNKQSDLLSIIEQKLATLGDDKAQLEEQITEMKERQLELETAVDALSKEYRDSRTGIDDMQAKVTELQVQSASKTQEFEGLRSQLEMVERNLAEVNENLSRMTEESEKTSESLSSNQIMIEEKKVELERRIQESEQASANLAKERDEYEQQLAVMKEVEQFVSTALHGINKHQALISETQIKLEQLKMKEQYLIDQINERYMVLLPEVAENYRDQEGDVKATEEEVKDLKGKLSRIGEVNLSAIEEYDELIDRYEFLSQQFKDLTDAKEQLRKVIDRINRICSKRFKETFEAVNERFMKVFPVLFGGGEARLILIEDPEKGEMGIDIVAKPPGKKSQNVSLLSGGEKALTAVSLIFAIFLVKPSPFCLLDEVDAPLDDANVFRFNDLVKEMAKRSQIIIVTHNKHTMRVNEKLYGVTQEEKGVSKMVSVNLEEAEEAVAL